MNNTEKEIKDRFRDLDQQKKDAARAEEERIQREKQERISNSAIVRFYDFFQGKNNDYTDEELALLETIDDPELLDLDENGHLVLRSEEERAKMEGRQNAQILKDLLTEEKDGKKNNNIYFNCHSGCYTIIFLIYDCFDSLQISCGFQYQFLCNRGSMRAER